MHPKHGWLPHRPDIQRDASWFGIPLRQNPELSTRWEEFSFVKEVLEEISPGRLIDAACGFEPGVHIMPEIASSLGWHVDAVDLHDPAPSGAFGVGFPEDPRIQRLKHDILQLPYAPETFDAYVCVSVLEHLEKTDRVKALDEGIRVLKSRGWMIVTMDDLDPAELIQFVDERVDFGQLEAFTGTHMCPKVSFLLGQKA